MFKYRLTEVIIFKYKDNFFIDFGFKYVIELRNANHITACQYIKNIKLEESPNYIFFDFISLKFRIACLNAWVILEKAFQYNCFVFGRLLNLFNYGFSVGVLGLIGFLQQYNLFYVNSDLLSIFVINKINPTSSMFILSQKLLIKLVSKVLFKLTSQITTILKN